MPGDIIILNGGDRVPADARIIEAAALRAEESALTGESATVNKSPEAVEGRELRSLSAIRCSTSARRSPPVGLLPS